MTARYERMARSGDPVLREIATQLRQGRIRPAQLLAVPAYREVVQRGLTRLGEAARREAEARRDNDVTRGS